MENEDIKPFIFENYDPIEKYVPDINRPIHETRVDFSGKRLEYGKLHLVQYDKSLPLLAIKLYKNELEYALPANAIVRFMFAKPDYTIVSDYILGISSDRKTVYVEFNEQMSAVFGEVHPILELTIPVEVGTETVNKTAGSSSFDIVIDRNPVQEDSIESESVYKLAKVAQTGSYIDLKDKPAVSLKPKIVEELPEEGEEGYLYLVKVQGSLTDHYKEYIWLIPEEGEPYWEPIGDTTIRAELDAASGEHINEVGTPRVTKSQDSTGNLYSLLIISKAKLEP